MKNNLINDLRMPVSLLVRENHIRFDQVTTKLLLKIFKQKRENIPITTIFIYIEKKRPFQFFISKYETKVKNRN